MFALSPSGDTALAVAWRACSSTCEWAFAISTPTTRVVVRPELDGAPVDGPFTLTSVADGWAVTVGTSAAAPMFLDRYGDLHSTVVLDGPAPAPTPTARVVSTSGSLLLWESATAVHRLPSDTADGSWTPQESCVSAGAVIATGKVTGAQNSGAGAAVASLGTGRSGELGTWQPQPVLRSVTETPSAYEPAGLKCNGAHAVATFLRAHGADAALPQVLFAVTHDGGTHWSLLDESLLHEALASTGSDTAEPLAEVTDAGTVLLSNGSGYGLTRITTDGRSEQVEVPGAFGSVVADGRMLLAHVADGDRTLLRSTDDGRTWVSVPVPGRASGQG